MAHFSPNKVINRIITTLEAYDSGGGVYPFKDKCDNQFGDSSSNMQELLRQNEHIYIFYAGEEHEWLSNNETTGRLFIEFWVIDFTKGVSSTKEDFQADKLRAYLQSGGWKRLGIETDYPAMNTRPYFVQTIEPTLWLDDEGNPSGYLLTVFRGYISFDASME